jgi:hypothetical protein
VALPAIPFPLQYNQFISAMGNLPVYIALVFVVTTALSVLLFYKATNHSKWSLIILSAWLVIQAIISVSGFYTIVNAAPPHFFLLVVPPLLLIAILFLTTSGRRYIDSLDIKILTLLHLVRMPVELVLFWLCLHKFVPQLMTFEGRNFDVFSGLSAPFIFYYGFVTKQMNRKLILLWNFVCLALLINIVVNAILSAPFPFQQFAFTQPNIAILYFPFTWLPGCIVPLALFAHLVTIRKLVMKR